MGNYSHSPDCGEADTAFLAAADRAARRAAGVREPSLGGDRRIGLMEEVVAARAAEFGAGLDGPAALAEAQIATAAAAGRLDEDCQIAGRRFLRAMADAVAVAPDLIADALAAAGAARAADVVGAASLVESLLARVRDLESAVAAGVPHGR